MFNSALFDLKPIDGKNWLVQNAGELWGYSFGDGRLVVPPDGYNTNLASIPRIAWSIIGPPSGYGHGADYMRAVVPHDYLYEFAKDSEGCWVKRSDADRLMLHIMEQCGVHLWRREVMYAAVRVGGLHTWRKHKDGRPGWLAYV
jgi:hypothetical protein